MSKKYKLDIEISPELALMLRDFIGDLCLKHTKPLFDALEEMGFKEEPTVKFVNFVSQGAVIPYFNNTSYEVEIEREIFLGSTRKTVKVGDQEYYEDELAEALKNIKPL